MTYKGRKSPLAEQHTWMVYIVFVEDSTVLCGFFKTPLTKQLLASNTQPKGTNRPSFIMPLLWAMAWYFYCPVIISVHAIPQDRRLQFQRTSSSGRFSCTADCFKGNSFLAQETQMFPVKSCWRTKLLLFSALSTVVVILHNISRPCEAFSTTAVNNILYR